VVQFYRGETLLFSGEAPLRAVPREPAEEPRTAHSWARAPGAVHNMLPPAAAPSLSVEDAMDGEALRMSLFLRRLHFGRHEMVCLCSHRQPYLGSVYMPPCCVFAITYPCGDDRGSASAAHHALATGNSAAQRGAPDQGSVDDAYANTTTTATRAPGLELSAFSNCFGDVDHVSSDPTVESSAFRVYIDVSVCIAQRSKPFARNVRAAEQRTMVHMQPQCIGAELQSSALYCALADIEFSGGRDEDEEMLRTRERRGSIRCDDLQQLLNSAALKWIPTRAW
jgi:hypothetical protein